MLTRAGAGAGPAAARTGTGFGRATGFGGCTVGGTRVGFVAGVGLTTGFGMGVESLLGCFATGVAGRGVGCVLTGCAGALVGTRFSSLTVLTIEGSRCSIGAA